MRDYAKISPKFWIGKTGKKLRDAGGEAQLVALYLLTNPHANMIGLYYLPELFISHETGLPLEGASKGLQRCIEAGFCSYDPLTEMVWVHEMAAYQIAKTLKAEDNRCKGIQSEYDDLPGNPFLSTFYDKYGEVFHMKKRRVFESPSEAPLKPLRSQEQEQEQEQEQNPPLPLAEGNTDGECVKNPAPGSRKDGTNPRALGTNPRASGTNPRALGINPRETGTNPRAAAPAENEKTTPTPAAALSIELRKHGVQCQPADPRVIALAEQGIDIETVKAACEQAAQSKPGERIGIGYVVKILERWAADAKKINVKGAEKKRAPPDNWWTSDAGIDRKGRELGLQPRPMESYPDYKNRIFEEIRKREEA